VRDWLYVGDHCSAIRAVLGQGRSARSTTSAAMPRCENIDVVKTLCALLDRAVRSPDGPHEKR
jgi:dTDP-glucose 4,6-dehydratase